MQAQVKRWISKDIVPGDILTNDFFFSFVVACYVEFNEWYDRNMVRLIVMERGGIAEFLFEVQCNDDDLPRYPLPCSML